MKVDMLVRQAKAVLDFNWTGEYTMPGPRLYPHQWSWDSAFTAIGYCRYDQDRATRELRHLFEAQWKNGLLPQLVFNPQYTSYFPGPNFWVVSLFRVGKIRGVCCRREREVKWSARRWRKG